MFQRNALIVDIGGKWIVTTKGFCKTNSSFVYLMIRAEKTYMHPPGRIAVTWKIQFPKINRKVHRIRDCCSSNAFLLCDSCMQLFYFCNNFWLWLQPQIENFPLIIKAKPVLKRNNSLTLRILHTLCEILLSKPIVSQ